MMSRWLLFFSMLALVSPLAGNGLVDRQHVLVVGSSTAFPIVAAAAEHFGRHSDYPAPVVESTGTGGGFKLFCAGVGLQTPDVAMASRRMKTSERDTCERHGVTDIREVKIGFDGIVLAGKKGGASLDLQAEDVYLALARWVPAPDRPGVLVANPYQHWNEVRSDLPATEIRVYGPPPTSGTRDILVERMLGGACLEQPVMRELLERDPSNFNQHCQALREDGRFINAGENDSRIVRKLVNDPAAVGIFGFNYLDRNRDLLQGALINGVAPGFEVIESGEYPLSRPLYLYVKSWHKQTVAGLREYVASVTAPDSIGAEGRLVDKGLIPLPDSR